MLFANNCCCDIWCRLSIGSGVRLTLQDLDLGCKWRRTSRILNEHVHTPWWNTRLFITPPVLPVCKYRGQRSERFHHAQWGHVMSDRLKVGTQMWYLAVTIQILCWSVWSVLNDKQTFQPLALDKPYTEGPWNSSTAQPPCAHFLSMLPDITCYHTSNSRECMGVNEEAMQLHKVYKKPYFYYKSCEHPYQSCENLYQEAVL